MSECDIQARFVIALVFKLGHATSTILSTTIIANKFFRVDTMLSIRNVLFNIEKDTVRSWFIRSLKVMREHLLAIPNQPGDSANHLVAHVGASAPEASEAVRRAPRKRSKYKRSKPKSKKKKGGKKGNASSAVEQDVDAQVIEAANGDSNHITNEEEVNIVASGSRNIVQGRNLQVTFLEDYEEFNDRDNDNDHESLDF
jgi:hypothetical protein